MAAESREELRTDTKPDPGHISPLTGRPDRPAIASVMGEPYPPAPWRLRGDAVLVPACLHARRVSAAAGATPLGGPGGWTLGGILLARYASGSTLAYRELVVFSGLARAFARAGFVVSYIAVDSVASLAGGREIWGLPKRLADFSWTRGGIVVAEGGADVLRARVHRRPRDVPLPVLAPFFGERDRGLLHAIARGWLRGAPAVVDLEVPAASPLADLGLGGRRAGLVASGVDLLLPAPRRTGGPASGW